MKNVGFYYPISENPTGPFRDSPDFDRMNTDVLQLVSIKTGCFISMKLMEDKYGWEFFLTAFPSDSR